MKKQLVELLEEFIDAKIRRSNTHDKYSTDADIRVDVARRELEEYLSLNEAVRRQVRDAVLK